MQSEDYCNNQNDIRKIISSCLTRIITNDRKGYDPADLLNSQLPFVKCLPGRLKRLLTLINFYSPVNFRKLLKIKQAQNTTAMVLWGIVHQKLYTISSIPEYLSEIDFTVDWLLEHALKVDGTIGWTRTVDYQPRSGVVHGNNSTLTFINAKVADFFIRLYVMFNEERYLTLLDSVCRHIVHHTNRIKRPEGVCLSYVNDSHHEVLNASVKAGQALNNAFRYLKNPEFLELSMNILSYSVERQNQDGSWYYSYDSKNKPKKQIDFHQCYMLDGIKSYTTITNETLLRARDDAFIKGVRFYIDKMFDKNMRPYWRYPIKYPIDIHNVSHGVYFLSKYYAEFPEYEERLELLLRLMLTDFYDSKKHYFYYHGYPLFTVRHDFFRWNTMWALYALAEYALANFEKQKDSSKTIS